MGSSTLQRPFRCLQGGRDVHKGGVAGFGSGEGRSSGSAARHRVKIFNHHASQEVEVEVPEDRCELADLTCIENSHLHDQIIAGSDMEQESPEM